jgi:AbiV family abortive infection protein
MAKPQELSAEALLRTIQACIENGERLLEESYNLEFLNPPSTRFVLVMIAQEEFAKAFILYLIKEGTVPFTPSVLRAMNDHASKQLVGMIMDYMIMHWDNIDELKAAIDKDYELGDRLPYDVGSAMDLLRFQKIGGWEPDNWFWAEDPDSDYDTSALRIAEGKKDRHKQDALYVRIGRDGRVCSTPQIITQDETCDELARADRYRHFVNSLLSEDTQSELSLCAAGSPPLSTRHGKAMAAIKLLFIRKPAS